MQCAWYGHGRVCDAADRLPAELQVTCEAAGPAAMALFAVCQTRTLLPSEYSHMVAGQRLLSYSPTYMIWVDLDYCAL